MFGFGRRNSRDHWERIYSTQRPDEVGWYQREPIVSLSLIDACELAPSAPILDVGGGASVLVDRLLDRGYTTVAVLDIADAALAHSRGRLDRAYAERVEWIVADVVNWQPRRQYALWHDRAVFHFQTDAAARRLYASVLARAVLPGGFAVIATFAPDGPKSCAGLPVTRYDRAALSSEIGPDFKFIEERREAHVTPGGHRQAFLYQRFKRR